MAVLETKYSVGDVIFYASTVQSRSRHPCPDCLGTKKWRAQSPAGAEFEFACPRCSTSYMGDRDLSLDYTAYAPVAGKLTIGSIQVDTKPWNGSSAVRYMCVETGVGSGSIYDEARLFETEEEALAAAQVIADEQNTTNEWIVKQYDKSLKISDYELENAKIKLADETNRRAGSLLWNLGYLFGEIEEADDKDAILEAVQRYREYDWDLDKEKIAAGVVAPADTSVSASLAA